MQGSRPRDPLPAPGSAVLDNADAVVLTREVHAKVIDGGGWDWLNCCRIQVGNV